MGLEQAINSGKEHRRQYRGAKAVDPTCRNHGGGYRYACIWCERNRLFKYRRHLEESTDKLTYSSDDN